MATISIIIPAYNAEKYIRQCMDSLRNQTYKDIEIICIDDGSVDATPTILDEYAEMDTRIKIIHKKMKDKLQRKKMELHWRVENMLLL